VTEFVPEARRARLWRLFVVLIMGAVAVTGIGIAIVVGLVLFLLILLKLSFRGLPVKSAVIEIQPKPKTARK
jgi:uncharacterized protein (DUF58 family)